ncbi:hypothetical protein NP233_g8193 [Leucocoprinus birnbaumii]|uniref:Uncharacterized protein n=1 Tax=Leucocoprinus birnbaumii TaxID=56174 RepID=A0AAD5VQH2_9AGAR|nr:hypothetical protein NP233_g8193 [Leucocoprinus birnbaumii]
MQAVAARRISNDMGQEPALRWNSEEREAWEKVPVLMGPLVRRILASALCCMSRGGSDDKPLTSLSDAITSSNHRFENLTPHLHAAWPPLLEHRTRSRLSEGRSLTPVDYAHFPTYA